MGFFYKHIIHPLLSAGIGKKALTNNPYLGFVIENEDNAIADELFMVGLSYHNGWFMLPQDDKKAVAYIHKAAEQGHATAQITMMRVEMQFPDDTNNEAMYWLQKAASQGEPQAMYNLGISYHRGDIDGRPNIEKSNELFRKAAEADYHAAFQRMAVIYINGEGVERNLNIAKYWAWLDFANLSEEARHKALLLQLLTKDDIADGNRILHKKIIEDAAQEGERDAINNWGTGLINTGEKEKGLPLIKQAVALKHPNSMVTLARQYWVDTVKDYATTKRLLEEAVATCNVHAYRDLAVLYYQGLGVDKNLTKAWSYLEKAINLGDNEARDFFANILVDDGLKGVIPPITGRAMNYMELASMDGYSPKD